MRANAPQLPGGGMGAAGIDWCISRQPRMSACRNTVVSISSSLCVLKRCKLFLVYTRVFFLSHGPLTSTRKEIKYNIFVIILFYFSVRYSKTTKFPHLVHNEIRWRQDSTVLAAVRTAGASTVCKEKSQIKFKKILWKEFCTTHKFPFFTFIKNRLHRIFLKNLCRFLFKWQEL